VILKIRLVDDGFADSLTDEQVFLQQSFQYLLGSYMADLEHFADRIGIIIAGVLFE